MGIANTGEIICLTILGFLVIVSTTETPIEEATEKVEKLFLKEENQIGNSDSNISETFCDSQEPICQKFIQMLQNQNQRKSNLPIGSRARRSYAENNMQQVNCNPEDPICQKFELMLNQQTQRKSTIRAELIQSEPEVVNQEKVQNNEVNIEKLECDETDPICQKFQGMLQVHEREQRRKTQNRKKPSSGAEPTPWCDFYCDFHEHKVCYANEKCGEPVSQDQNS